MKQLFLSSGFHGCDNDQQIGLKSVVSGLITKGVYIGGLAQ